MAKEKAKFVFTIDSADEKSRKFKVTDIRADQLAKIITHLDAALSAIVIKQHNDDFGGFSITSITRGCLNFSATGPAPYNAANQILADIANGNNKTAAPTKAKQAIAYIEEFNYAHNTKFEIRPDKKSPPIATIMPKASPLVELHDMAISGETTLYGQVVGISGIDSIKAKLKLITGETIEFPVSSEEAKFFGSRYHDTVGVIGNAVWKAGSRSIEDFSLKSVSTYDEQRPSVALETLREQFHTDFDQIEDVDAFVAAQRGA